MFEESYYLKQMKLKQMEKDAKFAKFLIEPAGAKSGEVTHADNYSEYQPFEQPLRTNKRNAFPQYSGMQSNTPGGPSTHQLEIQRVEAERRRREKEREEVNLYRAVQPGNDLNRHVTGDVYAKQLMNDMAEKRMRKEEERRRRIEEERRDDERVRREADKLKGEVLGEIDKQRQRHELVERGDKIARQQYEQRINDAEKSRGQGQGGFSTSEYFENRLSKPKDSHSSRLQEMREKRWAMEKAASGGGMGGGSENWNPQAMTQVAQVKTQVQHRGGNRGSSIKLGWD